MTSRERIFHMLSFQSVDKAPLEYHRSPRGLYDFGDVFRQKVREVPGDFEDFSAMAAPVVPPNAYDTDGSYHEFRTDEWGVEWEYRIFSETGHPSKQPLADMSALSSYKVPEIEYENPMKKQELREHIAKVKEYGFSKMGWVGFFEKLHALRPFEDVLMDIYEDTPEINELADKLVEHQLRELRCFIEADIDAVQFGDDFGTERGMLMSAALWRHFFKPRYQKLIAPVKAAGKKVFFHLCGYSMEILPDLKELGVDLIWPQLSVYHMEELAARLKEMRLACALHIDRAKIMTLGTPEEVRRAVHFAAKTFDIMNGGAMFYVEIDNGFPFENIAALIDTIGEYRK